MATDEDRATRAAALLWAARRERRRLAALPDDCAPATVAAGYAVQEALIAQAGAAVAGWKIAATSAAGQAHIRVTEPLSGPLFATYVVADGATIDLSRNRMGVAEVEFAFRFARSLPPRGQPYGLHEVVAAVADLHLAIEVPDSRFEDFESVGAPALIADDACAGWFMLGPRVPEWRAPDLKLHRVQVLVDGRVTAIGSGANVLGDPCQALRWFVADRHKRGRAVPAGAVVTTGTCVTPVPVTQGARAVADFGLFGQVAVTFA